MPGRSQPREWEREVGKFLQGRRLKVELTRADLAKEIKRDPRYKVSGFEPRTIGYIETGAFSLRPGTHFWAVCRHLGVTKEELVEVAQPNGAMEVAEAWDRAHPDAPREPVSLDAYMRKLEMLDEFELLEYLPGTHHMAKVAAIERHFRAYEAFMTNHSPLAFRDDAANRSAATALPRSREDGETYLRLLNEYNGEHTSWLRDGENKLQIRRVQIVLSGVGLSKELANLGSSRASDWIARAKNYLRAYSSTVQLLICNGEQFHAELEVVSKAPLDLFDPDVTFTVDEGVRSYAMRHVREFRRGVGDEYLVGFYAPSPEDVSKAWNEICGAWNRAVGQYFPNGAPEDRAERDSDIRMITAQRFDEHLSSVSSKHTLSEH